MLLIVGQNSLLGGAIAEAALARNIPLACTSRHPSARWHLDLLDSPELWKIPPDADQAILCAAVTGLENCERDPAGTRAVNVTATIALAERLAEQGTPVTFLSSNRVFGPDAVLPAEDDSPGPLTEYGRQKLMVERHLLERVPGSKIIRLTKVVSPRLPLFVGWRNSFENGDPVTAYDNLYLCPLAFNIAAASILEIGMGPQHGVFHLSASDSLSYFDVACWLAARTGAPPHSILPAGAPRPNTPESCSLNCRKTSEQTGFCLLPAVDHLGSMLRMK